MKTIWPEGLKGKELFRYMIANKSSIMDMKKAALKHADIVTVPLNQDRAIKALATKQQYLFSNDEPNGILKRTIVMNTYNHLDSHDDVHQNNLFAKSIADRGTRIPHLHDHIFQLDARVGMPISWSEKSIAWSEVGSTADGNTMALILESEILKDLNKSVYKDYLAGRIDQHSVWMGYVKLELALNDPDYEDEYKTWVATFDKIDNKQACLDQGYYFAIWEGRLLEGSAVLLGSNELTPTLGTKFQPSKDTEMKTGQPARVPLNVEELVRSYKV